MRSGHRRPADGCALRSLHSPCSVPYCQEVRALVEKSRLVGPTSWRLPGVRRSSASPGFGRTQPYARRLGRKLLRRATSIRGPSASSSSSPGRGSWCLSRLTQLRASCSHIGDRTAPLGENGPPQPLRLVSRLGPALLEAVDEPTDAWGLHPFQVANFPRPTW